MNSATAKKSRPRPLSPHIQVYSWLITSTLSIFHRLSGVANSIGLLLLVCWLLILAYSDSEKYEEFTTFLNAPLGRALLIGWTLSLYYHLLNGIRHLFWDFGKGFALPNVTRSGVAVLLATAALTAATWGVVLGYIQI